MYNSCIKLIKRQQVISNAVVDIPTQAQECSLKDYILTIETIRNRNKFTVEQPFTPIRLMREITDQLGVDKTARVAVLFTVEWAVYLKAVGYTNTVIITETVDPIIQKICNILGIEYILLNTVMDAKMRFDAVVGNPPFDKTTAQSRQREFYQQFVYQAHQLANVVALIYPSRWTSVNNATYKKFSNFLLDSNLTYFKWLPGGVFPGIQMTTCYTITDQTQAYSTTIIEDQLGNQGSVDIKTLGFYPSDLTTLTLLTKLKSTSNIAHRARAGSLYENQLTAGNNKIVFRAGRSNEPITYYHGNIDSINKTALVGIDKVVISRNGAEQKLGPAKVCDRDAGVGFACFGLATDSITHSTNLVTYLNSNLVKFIVNQYKRGTKGNSKELFGKIPEVDLNMAWDDDKLYKLFNITLDEQSVIESTIR
jgi:hypothetical protein